MARSLRLRVFAGPNGSGKSTMYEQVRNTVINGRPVDLGVYVNPDEIARELRKTNRLDLGRYDVSTDERRFSRFARSSGLLKTEQQENYYMIRQAWGRNVFKLRYVRDADVYAQLLSQHIVDELITAGRKCSFETVFSHPSKLEVMRRARKAGYKVYLYFIATNSVDINKDRIRTRVLQGGHDVPADRVESRYERSLAQILPAIELCYHAFMFDNSGTVEQRVMFAEMKEIEGGRSWAWDAKLIPDWFIRSYLVASGKPPYIRVAHHAIKARKT